MKKKTLVILDEHLKNFYNYLNDLCLEYKIKPTYIYKSLQKSSESLERIVKTYISGSFNNIIYFSETGQSNNLIENIAKKLNIPVLVLGDHTGRIINNYKSLHVASYPPKKILLATDGSECAKRAEKYAIELAKKGNGEATAISVGNTSYAAVPMGIDGTGMLLQVPIADAIENETKNTEKFLNEFKEIAEKENVKVNTIARIGNPASEIIEESEKGYDVIVVGSKGLSGIKRCLLGSVAEHVVRYSKIPVLVVKDPKNITM